MGSMSKSNVPTFVLLEIALQAARRLMSSRGLYRRCLLMLSWMRKLNPKKAFLIAAGVCGLLNACQRRIPAPPMNQRKVIFLGPGCGHIAYTMGFLHGLLSDQEIRDAVRLHGAVFGGVSSGAQAAAFAMATLHGALDMRQWYKQNVRPGFELLQNNSTLVIGGAVEEAALRAYQVCADSAGGKIPWLDKFVVSFTDPLTLLPSFQTSFDSKTDFAKAIKATSFVPLVMGMQPWALLESGRRVFDGYLGLLRIAFPDNYMYVSFLPTVPEQILGKHVLPVHALDSTPESILVKSYPWGDPSWADAAFERGLTDATKASSDLKCRLLSFLNDSREYDSVPVVARTSPRQSALARALAFYS